MLLTALKALTPLAAAALLVAHTTGAMAASTIGLANESGSAADCAAPVRDSACATLFSGATALAPGGPAQVRQVRITYSGDRPATLGVFADRFSARSPQSSATCQAADPAGMLDVTITEGASTLYRGTLAGLAAEHGSAPQLLALPGTWTSGAAHTYQLAVGLDPAAGNDYMGCVSAADFVWVAAQ